MFQYWDIIATLAFLTVYLYLFRKHAYWTSRGVPFRQPDFFYGSTKAMGRTEQVSKFFQRFYTDFKGLHSLVGMYHYLSPIALVIDLELVKRILELDFESFQGRGTYYDEKHDPLSARMYNLSGSKWKKIHSMVAPLFSTDNLKATFSLVLTIGKQLHNLLGDKVEDGKEIEIKNFLEQSFNDLIAKCNLGIDSQLKMISRQGSFKRFLVNYTPRITRILRVKEFDPQESEPFLEVIRNEVDYRLNNNISKDDLLDMLIRLRNPDELTEGQLSFEEVAAQSFGFYIAILETCPTLLTWTLYELAKAQVLQKKVRQHVKTILTTFNGEMCFEAISAMTYLDQIVKESLRKYPPVPVLIRETTKTYRVPNTSTTLEAGTPIYIPVYAIHHDPELYPAPERFDPERFSPKDTSNRNPYAWLPFGEGPRACLGAQLGMMQTKVVLAHLLTNFRFTIGKKCSLPLEVDVKSFVLTLNDLWLKVERI